MRKEGETEMTRTASYPHYGFSSAPECAGFSLAPNAPALPGFLPLPANTKTNLSSTLAMTSARNISTKYLGYYTVTCP